ncbi:hypothetical protein [Anabaena azotica]|nr:hypothetical protein [Anabaena azotica]
MHYLIFLIDTLVNYGLLGDETALLRWAVQRRIMVLVGIAYR